MVDSSYCATAEHIQLEYAVKKELGITHPSWRNVLRDSIYGLVVSALIVAAAAVVFDPVVAAVICGGLLALEALCVGYRLATGHKPGCAAKLATLTVFRVYDYAF